MSVQAEPTNSNVVLAWPQVEAMWTPYDPLDLSSESIDPLGFGRGYMALADRLLPGFTTVTVVPRYASMLCAAVEIAEQHHPRGSLSSASKERQKRLDIVKSFERAWALSCTLAALDGDGDAAILGLRGVRSVQRLLAEKGAAQRFNTGSFNLLSNQVRYGGIGTYSNFLEKCRLADMEDVTLKPLGTELAATFPRPDTSVRAWDEECDLDRTHLTEWGHRAATTGFSPQEAKVLRRALSGERDGDRNDRLRWTALRMLSRFQEQPEPELFLDWISAFRTNAFNDMEAPPDCSTQLRAVLPVIAAFEKFYQATLYLFFRMLASATAETTIALTKVSSGKELELGFRQVQRRAHHLNTALKSSLRVHEASVRQLQTVFVDSGVLGLSSGIQRCKGVEVLRLVLTRHRDVQQGKFDRAVPKAPWIREVNGIIQLTAQRHRLQHCPDSWSDISWHPYRTDAAFNFIKACRIQ